VEIIAKLYILIIFSIILVIFISHSPEVIAEDNDWLGAGKLLKQKRNYTGAVAAYNKALEIDPNDVNAWDGKGWALIELGNYTQAISYLNKALEIDPKHIDALVFKGQSLYGLGNHTGAKYYFDNALKLDPGNELAKRIYNNLIKK
jgi:tetratricopeptide (TPR) repeat protein